MHFPLGFWSFSLRFWLAGPRVFGIRPGVSFGPEDFRRMASAGQQQQSAQGARRTSSFVYVIENSHGDVKVGISADPNGRMANLQTGNPFPLRLAYVAAVKSDRGDAIETAVHGTLDRHRKAGEWFGVSVEMAVAAIAAASFRVNDPIVAVDPGQVDRIIALSQASQATPQAAPRSKWPTWTTFAIFAVLIVAGLYLIDPDQSRRYWEQIWAAALVATYPIMKLLHS
jgi:T5orf172 domain